MKIDVKHRITIVNALSTPIKLYIYQYVIIEGVVFLSKIGNSIKNTNKLLDELDNEQLRSLLKYHSIIGYFDKYYKKEF